MCVYIKYIEIEIHVYAHDIYLCRWNNKYCDKN